MSNSYHSPLLVVWPAATLAVGMSLSAVATHEAGGFDRASATPVLAAIVAPVLAMIALQFVSPGFDLVLVSAAAMLTAIGTATLTSLAAEPGPDQDFYTAIAARHALFVAVGFLTVVMGAFAARHVDRLRNYPYTLVALALLLTALTVLIGESANGARLWLRVGPARFQPSEIARLCLAAFAAIYLYDRRHLIAAPWRVRSLELPPAPYLIPLGVALLGAVAVLVLQNDLGMAALVVLGAFAALSSVQQSRSFLGLALILLGGAGVSAYVWAARVRDRVAGWRDPWRDPAGSGFQFVQSEVALAAGGVAGQASTPPVSSVPEVHTDLILVAIASQFGVAVAAAVLALSAILVCRCVAAALRVSDGFRSLLILSLAALIGVQLLLIVGGTLRVVPLTGLTFPLVSYGGTSMLVTLFAFGVIVGAGAGPR